MHRKVPQKIDEIKPTVRKNSTSRGKIKRTLPRKNKISSSIKHKNPNPSAGVTLQTSESESDVLSSTSHTTSRIKKQEYKTPISKQNEPILSKDTLGKSTQSPHELIPYNKIFKDVRYLGSSAIEIAKQFELIIRNCLTSTEQKNELKKAILFLRIYPANENIVEWLTSRLITDNSNSTFVNLLHLLTGEELLSEKMRNQCMGYGKEENRTDKQKHKGEPKQEGQLPGQKTILSEKEKEEKEKTATLDTAAIEDPKVHEKFGSPSIAKQKADKSATRMNTTTITQLNLGEIPISETGLDEKEQVPDSIEDKEEEIERKTKQPEIISPDLDSKLNIADSTAKQTTTAKDESWEEKVRNDWKIFKFMPPDLVTEDLCVIAVKINIDLVYYIPGRLRTVALYSKLVNENSQVLKMVPSLIFKDPGFNTLCENLIRKNPEVLNYIAPADRTVEFCKIANEAKGEETKGAATAAILPATPSNNEKEITVAKQDVPNSQKQKRTKKRIARNSTEIPRETQEQNEKANKSKGQQYQPIYQKGMEQPKANILPILSEESYVLIENYLNKIKMQGAEYLARNKEMGNRLFTVLKESNIQNMSVIEFIDALLKTTHPLVFAENGTHVKGDGSDWTNEEISLLGRIGRTVEDVQIYSKCTYASQIKKDDIIDDSPRVTMLFGCGALLTNSKADYARVIDADGNFNKIKYFKFIEENVLPLLYFANEDAGKEGATLTLPILGGKAFSGKKYENIITEEFPQMIVEVIKKHRKQLPNIKEILITGCGGETKKHGSIPGTETTFYTTDTYCGLYPEEIGGSKTTKKYAVVAGDHLSFPANDAYIDSPQTSEGGTSILTTVLAKITDMAGFFIANFKEKFYRFRPKIDEESNDKKVPDKTWLEVCQEKRTTLNFNSIIVYGNGGAKKEIQFTRGDTYDPLYLGVKPDFYLTEEKLSIELPPLKQELTAKQKLLDQNADNTNTKETIADLKDCLMVFIKNFQSSNGVDHSGISQFKITSSSKSIESDWPILVSIVSERIKKDWLSKSGRDSIIDYAYNLILEVEKLSTNDNLTQNEKLFLIRSKERFSNLNKGILSARRHLSGPVQRNLNENVLFIEKACYYNHQVFPQLTDALLETAQKKQDVIILLKDDIHRLLIKNHDIFAWPKETTQLKVQAYQELIKIIRNSGPSETLDEVLNRAANVILFRKDGTPYQFDKNPTGKSNIVQYEDGTPREAHPAKHLTIHDVLTWKRGIFATKSDTEKLWNAIRKEAKQQNTTKKCKIL